MFNSRKKRKVWPSKKKCDSATRWIEKNGVEMPSISKSTPISSMGSCFAREIKNWLTKNDYNYLLGEEREDDFFSHELFPGDLGQSPSIHASVAWERVYNTFTIKNIIDYSLNQTLIQNRFLEVQSRTGKKYVTDLVRSRMIFRNMDEAEANFANHANISKHILLNSKVFILTLGLIEIWQSEESGIVLGAHPGTAYSLPPCFKPRVSTYKENIENLTHVVRTLKSLNSDLKIVITVSPVHLLKTEREDSDVISASCYSKSLLRVAADEMAEFEDVFYFPSYEIATICSNIDGIQVYPDNHHVSKEVVERIMKAFMTRSSSSKIPFLK